jgi:hypothetical protein
MTATKRKTARDRRGPEAIGSIVKRYRKRDRQYTYSLRVRAYGERYWVPLGTEREGSERRPSPGPPARDRCPHRPRGLAPAEHLRARPAREEPGLPRVRQRLAQALPTDSRRVDRRQGRVLPQPPSPAVSAHVPAGRDRLRRAVRVRREQVGAQRGDRVGARGRRHGPRCKRPSTTDAQPADDQHVTRSGRARALGRGEARTPAEQPGSRPRAAPEGDTAQGKLPRSRRVAGADRGGIGDRRSGLARDPCARTASPQDAASRAAVERDRRRARSGREHGHLAGRAIPQRGTRLPVARSSPRSDVPGFATPRCATSILATLTSPTA